MAGTGLAALAGAGLGPATAAAGAAAAFCAAACTAADGLVLAASTGEYVSV